MRIIDFDNFFLALKQMKQLWKTQRLSFKKKRSTAYFSNFLNCIRKLSITSICASEQLSQVSTDCFNKTGAYEVCQSKNLRWKSGGNSYLKSRSFCEKSCFRIRLVHFWTVVKQKQKLWNLQIGLVFLHVFLRINENSLPFKTFLTRWWNCTRLWCIDYGFRKIYYKTFFRFGVYWEQKLKKLSCFTSSCVSQNKRPHQIGFIFPIK